MSSRAPLQKRSSAPLFLLAFAGVLATGAGAYVLLVHREQLETERLRKEATHLEAQIKRGSEWLAGRPVAEEEKARIAATAAEFVERIPSGRRDVAVAQEWQRQATRLGLTDFQYEVVGGLALPEDHAAKERPAESRLATNPAQLRGVAIGIQFSGGYRETLAFLRTVALGPWRVEIAALDLKRPPRGTVVETRVTTRYFYE